MKLTEPNSRAQIDLTINFFELANKYESDGTDDGGWFKCLLIDLCSEPRGKVLIDSMSELALKWLTSPLGIKVLKNLDAEYLTMTIAYPESNTSVGWHDKEFDTLFNSWRPWAHSSMPNSPFEPCSHIKCVALQLGNWYIYFKGYEQRPFPHQTHMIILPPSWHDYNVHLKQTKHWEQWRNAKYGIVYD